MLYMFTNENLKQYAVLICFLKMRKTKCEVSFRHIAAIRHVDLPSETDPKQESA
jgi:hypothetical protein